MTTNFAELLNKPAASAERPKPAPAGSYVCSVAKFEFGESSQKKTPYVRFHYAILSPGQDVDQAALMGLDLGKKQFREDFYLTDDALYRLTEHFAQHLKMDVGSRSFQQLIPEAVGRQVICHVKQVPSQKPGSTDIFNEIEGFSVAA